MLNDHKGKFHKRKKNTKDINFITWKFFEGGREVTADTASQ